MENIIENVSLFCSDKLKKKYFSSVFNLPNDDLFRNSGKAEVRVGGKNQT